MHPVTTNSDYIPALMRIANNPQDIIKKYEMPPISQRTSYSINYGYLVTGIALAVVSLGLFEKSKRPSAAFFSIGLFCFYKSFNPVDSDKLKSLRNESDKEIQPCNDGLKAERIKKMGVLVDTIHGKPKESLEDVKNSIDIVSAIYDGLKDPSEYIEPLVGTRVLEQDLYTSIRESCKKLMDLQIASFPDAKNMETHAKEKLIDLCAKAKLFYVGDNTGTNEPCYDAYAHYGFFKTAIICPLVHKD